jgi:hypothetical protein
MRAMEGLNAVTAKVVAIQWASQLDMSIVKGVDRPHVEPVLVEASLFQHPAPDLVVAVNDIGELYEITVRGYTRLMDDEQWYNTFLGPDRPNELDHVVSTCTQMTEVGAIKVIRVQKIKFHHVNPDQTHGGDDDNGRKRGQRKRRYRR